MTAFGEHEGVECLELVDEVDDEYLVRVEWNVESEGILRATSESDVSVLSAVGTSRERRFEVRADESADVSACQSKCREYGVPIELESRHNISSVRSGAQYGLTDTQYEALVLACEPGYYHSPREVDLDQLADEPGITGQSVGSRLRRGVHRLVENTLIESGSRDGYSKTA